MPALSVVLEDIARNNVDKIECLGDIATLGPNPREAILAMRDLQCTYIMGNHEQAMLDPDHASSYGIGNNLDSTLRWSIAQLGTSEISWIHGITNSNMQSYENRTCLYHGTPHSTVCGIYPDTPVSQIDEWFQCVDESLVLCAGGHTHVQMFRPHRNRLLINPGSVGCAFVYPSEHGVPPLLAAHAEYAIVHIDKGGWRVDFKKIAYSLSDLAYDISRVSHPLSSWWNLQFARMGIV